MAGHCPPQGEIIPVPKRIKRAKPDPELLKLPDSLLANCRKPEDLSGENGLLKQLTRMLAERALEVEMTGHLGHDKSGTAPMLQGRGGANLPDGMSPKMHTATFA